MFPSFVAQSSNSRLHAWLCTPNSEHRMIHRTKLGWHRWITWCGKVASAHGRDGMVDLSHLPPPTRETCATALAPTWTENKTRLRPRQMPGTQAFCREQAPPRPDPRVYSQLLLDFFLPSPDPPSSEIAPKTKDNTSSESEYHLQFAFPEHWILPDPKISQHQLVPPAKAVIPPSKCFWFTFEMRF